MKSASRVLIVDESAESREVLRTLVERSGAEAVEANRPSEALALTDALHPDIIVLDLDSDASPQQSDAEKLGVAADRTDTPIVVLGTLTPSRSWGSGSEIVHKPYHYGPLVHRIETLLASRRAA